MAATSKGRHATQTQTLVAQRLLIGAHVRAVFTCESSVTNAAGGRPPPPIYKTKPPHAHASDSRPLLLAARRPWTFTVSPDTQPKPKSV